jgi:transposase
MIVVGVDVHKRSLTAVAVDEVGRPVAEQTVGDGQLLLRWAASLSEERLWALEDCRQLTRSLERELLAAGERLVRVPPKLMAPQRRAGRIRGKSDPIDALAVARAALREPRLDHPRPGEERLRELKLLVDHRGRSRPSGLARPARTASRSERADSAGADRTRARRPLPQPDPHDPRPRPRAPAARE